MQRLSRTFLKASLVLVILSGFLFLGAAPAQADLIDDIAGGFKAALGNFLNPLSGIGFLTDKIFGVDISKFNPVSWAVSGLASSIVNGLAAIVISVVTALTLVLFSIAGTFISAALDFNAHIPDIAQGGYKIILGVANMGFIVALVVIAFGTMFRSDTFGYKKALPRLIIAALLINFGFFIAVNFLINPVDQVTLAIQNAASPDFSSIGNLWKPEYLFQNFSDLKFWDSHGNSLGEQVGKAVASVIGAFIFAFIGIIALFAFAIMLFIRGLALAILVTLLPLAWAGLVFPNLKIPGGGNPWKTWWEQFTKWLLFAPFAMFFFFLSIQLAQNQNIYANPESSLGSSIGLMVLTAGLMLGGLYVSNRMGIAGAGIALGAVAAGKVWAQGKLRYGRKAAYEASKKALPRERLKKLETLGKGRGFFRSTLTAPIRAAARGAAIQTAAITKEREAAFLEKIKNLAPSEISDMYAGLSEENRAYALKHMIDKGYDWELVPEARQDIIRWNKEGTFDANHWGLKKAELDLIDSGISPNALEVMEPYRPRLAKAIEEGDEEEIERIKYILGLEVEEVLRKDLNVVTASGMGKLQRRTFSSNLPDEKRPGEFKVGYQMFGNDEVGATMATIYGGAEMRYISHDRADTTRRLKGATRGDGARNLSQANAEGLETLQKWFVEPLLETSAMDPGAFRGLPAPAKIAHFKKHWTKIQARAKVEIAKAVEERQKALSLSDDDAAKALELELKKAERAVPEKLVADLQQLLDNTKGSSHTILAT